MSYQEKYLKYKKKYLILKNIQIGGIREVSIQKYKSQFIAGDILMEHPSYKIGILIAGNAGRPGGGLGKKDGSGLSGNIHKHYSTQEEDVIASWLRAEENIGNSPERVFRENLGDLVHGGRPWGMLDSNGTGVRTIQGRDFTRPFHNVNKTPKWSQLDNYNFAYSLKNKPIKVGNPKIIADLVFVYGPNVAYNSSSDPTGTGYRTKVNDYTYDSDYDVFRGSVKTAIRAGLLEMIKNGTNIAILAPISGGIYSYGRTQRDINLQYEAIINEILSEPNQVSRCGRKIGDFFMQVILPRL
jgi:hypothetical protein